MAIFKCKICGGTLEINDEQSIATCEYCGTKQTIPKLDDDRKANLYDRANHFRRNNDFDKAMGIYENILNEDNTDSEAYWSIVLCRYGIEYVEDPTTHKRIPTVNRAQFTSIFDDEDYKSAIANADEYQREIYESEANAINEIQKGFLAISQKEEPFDVFICYKETDNNGRRTQDSVLATELYNELTREGFKVFFSRITLEDKLGAAYEPYIFAALHSAKVMVVLGTRPENFNAVWVKNEWSRFLALIKNGAKKTLIPAYRDMDPYDLPEEFSHLQAQDMSKLGFMQDLIRGIRKIVEFDEPKTKIIKETVITGANVAIEPLFKRADMALADGEFGSADAFYEQILNQDPENAEAYVGKLLSELHIKNENGLANSEVSFENSSNYKKAIQFANEELKNKLSGALQTVLARIDNKKKNDIYQRAKILLNGARDIPSCKNAQKLFLSISGYLDAEQCVASCQEKINDFQKEWEQLRLEQRGKEEERKIAAKKTAKRILIISLCLLLVAIIAVASNFFVTGVAIPNSQYKDALEMIEEQKYDDAISLLQTAKENALFDNTISKINKAIDDAETAKERKKAAEEAQKLAEEAKKALEQTVANGMSDIANTNYETAICTLLNAGVSTHIIYQCEGGNLIGSDSNEIIYASETEFSGLLTSERTGYRFVGWTCETYEYQEAETRFNLVFKANWSEKEYVIKYNLGGGTTNNVTEYGVEDEAFTLNAPTRTGYTFTGWTGTDLTQPTMEVTISTGSHGDRTYTANWQANSYSVSFDVAGGNSALNDATYTYDKSVTLPTPQRDAYTFAGWYNGTQKVSSGTWKTPTNVTLVAKWTPITYSVIYNLGEVPANNTNKKQFTVESNTITLSNLSYDYCTFEGWYSDSNFTNKVTEIPKGTWKNITLYAKWDIQTFTIEYDWNGGECSDSFITEYTVFDLPIGLPYPEKQGHRFSCWTDTDLDGDKISEIEECGDYYLYANYLISGMKVEGLVTMYGTHYYVSYSGYATEIEIPKYDIDGKIITAIDIINAPNLETVKMSNCIELIDSYAFYNCKKLKNITLPTNIKYINDNAFGGCDALQFQIYEGGKYLGTNDNPYYALIDVKDGMASKKTIHEQTVLIGNGSFQDSRWLTSIIIPSNVKYIGEQAFSGCIRLVEVYNLSSLNIQAGDDNIGSLVKIVHTTISQESYLKQQDDYWFYCDSKNGVYELLGYTGNDTTLILPNHINGNCYDIYDYAFYECDNLECVTISQGVTKIGNHSFYNSSRLLNVVISEGVVEIGYNSFFNCRELLSVTLPSTLAKIGSEAFHNCTNLVEIYNLSSLNIVLCEYGFGWLGYYAKVIHTSQNDSSNLIQEGDFIFYYDKTSDTYALLSYIGNSTSVILPDRINGKTYTIYQYAFFDRDDIADVMISDGVTEIGVRAFSQCSKLKSVVFENKIGWSTGTTAFSEAELSDANVAANNLTSLYGGTWIRVDTPM